MPPPPLRPNPDFITYSPSGHLNRPTPSRTHSFRDAPPSGLHRPRHQRRASVDSVASVELSDVAVMATWSFPASPSPEKPPHPASSRELDQDHGKDMRHGQSTRLRERLKSLSGLDTSCGMSNNDGPLSNNSGKTSASTVESTETVIRASRPLPSYLTGRHRHTYSSPNLAFPTPSGTGSPAPCVPLLIPFYQHHVRSGGLLQPGCASLIHSLCFQVIRHLLLLFKERIASEGRGN